MKLVHFAGLDSISTGDIKQFRQCGSDAPGRPGNFESAGIGVTTRPLGTEPSNAVGLAAAKALLAAVYNKPGIAAGSDKSGTLDDVYRSCFKNDEYSDQFHYSGTVLLPNESSFLR